MTAPYSQGKPRSKRRARNDKPVEARAKPNPDAKKKSDGRFAILNLFWARGPSDGNLKPSEITTWVYMWTAERKGFVSISYGQIARDTNLGHATVERAIVSLLEKDMAKVVRQGDVHGNVNRYVLSPYPSEGTLSERAKTYAQNQGRPTLKCAETYAQNEVYPDRKEEGVPSSSFRTGRADPADARLGDARPAVPTSQTNPDGDTIPLSPPSISTLGEEPPEVDDEAAYRATVKSMIEHRLADGQPLTKIKAVLMSLAGNNELHRHIIAEEIARRCASA